MEVGPITVNHFFHFLTHVKVPILVVKMDQGVIKLAVKNCITTGTNKGALPQLMTCPRATEDLPAFIIKSCTDYWQLLSDGGNDYTLRFEKTDEPVTKENQSLIVDGSVLVLHPSAARSVKGILESLGTHGDDGIEVLLQRLYAKDQQYVVELVEVQEGIPVILKRLLYDLDTHESSKIINFLIDGLRNIMALSETAIGYMTESEDGQKLVTRLASDLGRAHWDYVRLNQITLFLVICLDSPPLATVVAENLDIKSLLEITKSSQDSEAVQTSTLTLFNELVLLEPADLRVKKIRVLEELRVPQFIARQYSNNIDSCPDVLRRHLYLLQCWTLYKYGKRMNTVVDSDDHSAVEMIKELRKIAFERNQIDHHGVGGGTLQRSRFAEDYKTLGFESTIDPTKDFGRPPGRLALDLMHAFAKANPDMFTKLVLESSCRGDECPFAQSSIALVRVICEVLGVDREPDLDRGQYLWTPFVILKEDFFQVRKSKLLLELT